MQTYGRRSGTRLALMMFGFHICIGTVGRFSEPDERVTRAHGIECLSDILPEPGQSIGIFTLGQQAKHRIVLLLQKGVKKGVSSFFVIITS
jgi:hypothetical protein